MKKSKLLFICLFVACCTVQVGLSLITNPLNFNIPDRGAAFYETDGSNPTMTVGHARATPNAGSTTPAGFLMFRFKPSGVLVSEATVPVSPAISSGRIFAEVSGPVNTGVAIANPSSQPATITFNFTDASGQDFGNGTFILGPNLQIARFLNESPFNAGNAIRGTMTFTSSVPVSVIALRGLTNERGEFLITTLPVAAVGGGTSESVLFPHYADGGGWTTQVVLVNPTDATIAGSVQFLGTGGTTSTYTIPARSSVVIPATGAGSDIRVGGILLTPSSGSVTPSGLSIFSFRKAGVTVSEAGVPVLRPASAFRMYEEECGDYPGQLRTGVAIANPSSSAITVRLELTDHVGAGTGMSSTVTIPASGHIARFLPEFSGFENIRWPFHGVLRISTTSPGGIAVVGLRGRYNERDDFLITTAMPTDESSPASNAEMFFPHMVYGGGYTTEFIVYSGSAGQASTGSLRFFKHDGSLMN